MPVEQVGRLLRRWQETGGVLSRGRVIADGMRLISGLTPAERELVARALAEEGAPDLASRLAGASGGQLDAAELHRAAEGILALDRDQIDHLASALTDRDERVRLAHAAATYGTDQLGELAGAGEWDVDVPPRPPPPAPGTRLPDTASPRPPAPPADPAGSSYATDTLHAIANGEVPLGDAELGDQMLDHPGLGQVQLAETGLQEVGLGEVGLHEVGLVGTAPPAARSAATLVAGASAAFATDRATADEGERPPPAETDNAAAGHTSTADTTTEHATTEDTAIPLTDTTAAHDDAPGPGGDGAVSAVPTVRLDELGTPVPATVDAERVDALVAGLRGASTATERFRLLTASTTRGLDGEAALRVLDVVPSGWQRRRVATRLLDDGGLHEVEAEALVQRFPRSSDVAFVVGAAIAAGSLTIDAIHGVVPDAVRRRLALRTGI